MFKALNMQCNTQKAVNKAIKEKIGFIPLKRAFYKL